MPNLLPLSPFPCKRFLRLTNVGNLGHLLQRYRESKNLRLLAEQLASPATRVRLTGLLGAQESFVLAAAAEMVPRLHIFIANSKEEAAYRQNDLAGLLPEQTVRFFPDSFKRPAFFDDLNPTQVLQRSEVMSHLTVAAPLDPPMRGGAASLAELPGGLERSPSPPLMGGPGGAAAV
jgi:hypothetical protein